MKTHVENLMNEVRSFDARITQNIDEITFLFASVKNSGAKSLVEIGSEFGGSAWVLAHAMPIGSVIQCVDYPLNDAKSNVLKGVLKRLTDKGYITDLISGDSHSECVIEQLNGRFASGTVDAMFIDGDHSFKDVLTDFENFNHLVKDGGIIAFHDVSIPFDGLNTKCSDPAYDTRVQKRQDVEVSLFWNSMTKTKGWKSVEIDFMLKHRYGIGVVQKNVSGKQTIIGELNNANCNYTYWR